MMQNGTSLFRAVVRVKLMADIFVGLERSAATPLPIKRIINI
jgi:hypothetical protein